MKKYRNILEMIILQSFSLSLCVLRLIVVNEMAEVK